MKSLIELGKDLHEDSRHIGKGLDVERLEDMEL